MLAGWEARYNPTIIHHTCGRMEFRKKPADVQKRDPIFAACRMNPLQRLSRLKFQQRHDLRTAVPAADGTLCRKSVHKLTNLAKQIKSTIDTMEQQLMCAVRSVYIAPQLITKLTADKDCLLYTSPSPRDLSTSRMPSSA